MFKYVLMAFALSFATSPAFAGAPKAKMIKQIKKIEKKEKVELNTATLDQLVSLPGIGKKKAAAIIIYRTKTPFKTVAQATEVKGIGDKTVAKWQGLAFIAGPDAKAKPMTKPIKKKMKKIKKL